MATDWTDVLRKLWAHVSQKSERVHVRYQAQLQPHEMRRRGEFGFNEQLQEGKIVLWRPVEHARREQFQPADDELAPEDAWTLAHEYGHCLSFRKGNHTPEYLATRNIDEATWPTALTDAQKDLVYVEETTAWRLGRAVLADLGVTDFTEYDARTEQALGVYRSLLGRQDA